MRRGMARRLLTVVVLLALLIPWAGAEDSLEEQQRDSLDTSSLEEAAPDNLEGVGALELTDLEQGLETLKESVLGGLRDILLFSVRSAGLLLLIVLFCSLAESVGESAGGMSHQAVRRAGAGGVALVALSDMNSLIGLGRETIQSLSTFTTVLIPTMTMASVASGSVAAAPVRQAVTLLFSNFLTRIISSVLLPMTYAYAAGCVASAALEGARLQPLCKLLRWCVISALTIILLGYTGYLAVAGGVSATADATAMKAANLAISGMIPVVGGILSDATEAVFSGAAILRNSIGLFGVVGVLGFCAVPFVRLGVQFLVYKLAAALSATISDHPASHLIQDLGNVFALVMGMTGTCALVTLLCLISTISAVMP